MTPLALSPVGTETLDDTRADPAVVRATLRDLTLINALGGGRRAVALAFRALLARHGTQRTLSVLDVGAGAGDILAHLVRVAARRGIRVRAVALDVHPIACRLCTHRGLAAVVADAEALPVARDGVDIVVVSQVLHHLDRASAATVVRDLAGTARLAIVVADLRRAAAARAGVRLLAGALRLHPVTGRDGAVSVARGFTAPELRDVLRAAGLRATVRRRLGYRLVAVWERDRAHG